MRKPVSVVLRPGKAHGVVVACGLALWLTACAAPFRAAPPLITTDEAGSLPSGIKTLYEKYEKEGERNAVLNLCDIACECIFCREAIQDSLEPQLIDQALDAAMQRIEAIYADTPEARKARSVWHDEATKDFKGEPYERAFVFLMRGLRYYEAGDFQNARACFLSGILQDRLSEEGEYDADMATFEYLLALCNTKLGEDGAAREAMERCEKLCASVRKPQKTDNVLVVVLTGECPRKTQQGQYKEKLVLGPGVIKCQRIEMRAAQSSKKKNPFVAAMKTDDMVFQATTRGGRQIDEINARKAVTKEVTDKTGDVAVATGVAVITSAGSEEDLAAGAAILLIGVAAKAAAANMNPAADIRAIQSVPGLIFLWSGRLPVGSQKIEARFYDSSNELTNETSYDIEIPAQNDHTVVYLRCP